MLVSTIAGSIVAFVLGYKTGKHKDLMGPTYPPQLSGLFVGGLAAGLVALISLAIFWLFFAPS